MRQAWARARVAMLTATRTSGLDKTSPGVLALLRTPTALDQRQRAGALFLRLVAIWREAETVALRRLATSLRAFAELELLEVPRLMQQILARAERRALREQEEDIVVPASIRALFSLVPATQVAELLTTPLGGAFFAQAFGDLDTRTVTQLRNALTVGLQQGQGVPSVARAVQSVLNNTRWQAERIVRSEFGRIGAQAAQAQFMQNQGLLDGVQWVATLDQRTCIQCANLDGQTWDTAAAAPLPVASTHPNCVIGSTLVRTPTAIEAVTDRVYQGQVIDLRTFNHQLTCTPNHPILTRAGWVAADLLRPGDEIACGFIGPGKLAPVVDGYNTDVPPAIQQLAESFGRSRQLRAERVMVAAEDFHGDGKGSEVAHVWAHGDAGLKRQAEPSQCFAHALLQWCADESLRVTSRSLFEFFEGSRDAANRRMRGFYEGPALIGSQSRPPLQIALTDLVPTPMGGSDLSRPLFRRAMLPQGEMGEPPSRGRTMTVEHNTSLFQGRSQPLAWDADHLSQRAQSPTGGVQFDRLTRVEVREFRGQVYNLQSSVGWYEANGILTHNCRCVVVPIVKPLPFMPPDTGGTRASMAGQVPATLTYKDWFTQQDAAFQRGTLGPTRYGLWKSGKLKLGDFSTAAGVRSVADALALARSRT